MRVKISKELIPASFPLYVNFTHLITKYKTFKSFEVTLHNIHIINIWALNVKIRYRGIK